MDPIHILLGIGFLIMTFSGIYLNLRLWHETRKISQKSD